MTKTKDIFNEAAETALPSSDDEESAIDDEDTCSAKELDAIFLTKYRPQDESAVTLKKDYILSLCSDSGLTRLAAGLSNGSVQLFNVNAVRGLEPTHEDCIQATGDPNNIDTICGVHFLDETPNTLLVGHTNGLIRLFDLRSSKEEARFKQQTNIPGSGEVTLPITCFDRNANGRIICAGTEQYQHNVYMLFYDVRERKPLGAYNDSHQDDITAISFHKKNPDLLCTGSTDGLINVFDISQPDEDEALLNTINTESSVHKLNWHRNVYEKDIISCITHTNDFKSYECHEGDEIVSFVRENITAGIRRRNAGNFNLINAHNTADDGVFLLAGTNFNKGEILRSVRVLNKSTLEPMADFNGNKQIVRDSLYNPEQNVLVTGGESGIVTIWTADQTLTNNAGISNKLKTKTKLKSKKNTPY